MHLSPPSQSLPESTPPVRKRGAPPGNKNHLRHGFYSRAFHRSERSDLSQPLQGQFMDEINLFRVLIARAAEQLKPSNARQLSFRENLSALHAVCLAITRLHSFYRIQPQHTPDPEDDMRALYKRLGYTDEQIQAEILGESPGKRNPGAQPGNTNALKHGFYASVFKPDELRRLDAAGQGQLDDEMLLLRILIKRTVVSMSAANSPALEGMDYFKALRVLAFAASCLEKLERTQWLLFGSQEPLRKKFMQSFEQALYEFRKERGLLEDEPSPILPVFLGGEPGTDLPPPEPFDFNKMN